MNTQWQIFKKNTHRLRTLFRFFSVTEPPQLLLPSKHQVFIQVDDLTESYKVTKQEQQVGI